MRVELSTVYWTLKFVVLALWPISAFAAVGSFGDDFMAGSLLSIAVTALLSTTAGLTALLVQIKKDLEEYNQIKHLRLYVASKMMASNTAGLLLMFMTEGKLDHNYQAGVILVAAFGGTMILNKALAGLESVVDKFSKDKK